MNSISQMRDWELGGGAGLGLTVMGLWPCAVTSSFLVLEPNQPAPETFPESF